MVFVNDGGGIFADDSAARISLDPDFTRGLLLQDLDGDGDLDLALANTTQQNRLYLNDGAGVFADVTAARFPVDDTSSLAVTAGDVDGDGDPDLAFANNGQRDAIYVNVGAGSFANGESQRLPRQGAETLAAATADVNGDGAADLIFAGVSGTALHLNDGRGAFVDVSGSAFTPRRFDDTSDIAVGDLDGDGDQDLVLANGYITSRVFLNDGSGQFTEIQALPRRTNAAAVALGDVDGDGDLDVFFGDGRLYFNNSEARFFGGGPSRIPSLPSAILDAVMHDVDADGDLDLVLANDRTQNYLYLNDGTGTFRDATEERMPVDADRTFALAVADVDGDGAPDLALANLGTQNRLYLNDGAGRFTDVTAAQLPIDTDASNSVTAADVDLDGAVDLIWGNLREQNRFYANDGTGAFTDQTATRLASAMLLTQDVLLVDVDGDSDPDLITADYQTSNRLELNLAGQLDTPLLALLGRRYQLDFYSRFAGPQRFDTAVPLLAAAPARIALPPFGILGLDPPGLVALPPVAVPAGTGVGTLSFLLPNVPAAAGQTLYAQAVLVAGSGRAVLTNVTADTLLP
ncbi:MAG: VCBS repeat-containing protein [Planctomycetota bacterium]